MRIFTPREELPFAGHPTLGTAAVLKANAPEAMHGDTVTLALEVGPVPVRFEKCSNAGAGWRDCSGEMSAARSVSSERELDPRNCCSPRGPVSGGPRSGIATTSGFNGNGICNCGAALSGGTGTPESESG